MNILKYILIISVFGVFYSCNKNNSIDTDDISGQIILSATGNVLTPTVATKAAPAFPNSGVIGVIAGYYNDNVPVNWTSYSDINNVRATVSSVNDADSVYSFAWDTPKYWPFDGRKLAFMAYSPIADNSSVFLDVNNSTLLMELYDNMPDVLYASANDTSTMIGYNKLTPTVNLGEFKHALSQLTVEVVANNVPSTVVISSLQVITTRRSAIFSLQQGDNGLSVNETDNTFIYNLVSGNTNFVGSPISETVLLFPGTEDYTEIHIELYDGSNVTFARSYLMAYFQNTTNAQRPLILERGKNTVLRIEVQGTPTSTDDGKISLQGLLTGWNQKGNFGVNIF